MSSPAARLLINEGTEPGPVFALLGKVGRVPRIYASTSRDLILRQLQTVALNKMGITLSRKLNF